MTNVLYAVLVLGVLGAVFGLILAFASKIFAVKVDERQQAIADILPGANCGGCGYPGCSGYAAAVVEGKAGVTSCAAGGADVAAKIAEIMGVTAEMGERQVAYVHCSGNSENCPPKYIYEGVEDCVAATKLQNAPGACSFGCIGMGNCVRACAFDALKVENGVAVVDPEKCTGCLACAKACPRGIISAIPYRAATYIPCVSRDKGADTRKLCQAGCIGCRLCVKKCPSEAIDVVNNVAVIDYSKCTNCGECAAVCPRKLILHK